jgi:sugar lactone lactonase YvrE
VIHPFRSCLATLAVLAAAGSPALGEGVKLRPGPLITNDSTGGALLRPEGVACGAHLLAVADTGNGRFTLYDLADRTVTPRSEFAVPEIPSPVEIHFDPGGAILALDGPSRRIGRVGVDGAFQGFVTLETGGGPAPLVTAFAVGNDGSLYALDIAGGRVLETSGDGKLVRQIALPPECRAPTGIAVDASGRVFVAEASAPRLYAAAKDQTVAAPLTGSLREDMDFTGGVAVDGQGRVLVVDSHGGGIVIFGSDGSFRGRQSGFGWLEGQLRWPASICVGEPGFVAVADRLNNRVSTFVASP